MYLNGETTNTVATGKKMAEKNRWEGGIH